jgi:L-threonylcarbamoyladenylate synthase
MGIAGGDMLARWRLVQLNRILHAGGVIAYPTEAVWAGDIEQFDFLLWDLPDGLLAKLQLSWPGPNTWLVPHRDRLPPWITGVHQTVALRVSDHPLIRQMCAITGPLVSTSANPSGRPPARSRLRIEQYFHQSLDALVPGALGDKRNPSIIRDLQTDQIIRLA